MNHPSYQLKIDALAVTAKSCTTVCLIPKDIKGSFNELFSGEKESAVQLPLSVNSPYFLRRSALTA
jgi:hypothetical protein